MLRAAARGGYRYGDIDFGNALLDPRAGEAVVCDDYNVVENGRAVAVAGTIGFVAPESSRPDPGARPTAETDRHAPTVPSFYVFTPHHPLEGRRGEEVRCPDQNAEAKLYGREPLFVFDPVDESNRPHPEHH